MSDFPHAPPHPELTPGVGMGPWLLRERRGRGSFGVVFRVERDGHPEAGSFALKVALRPDDPRFAREVTLLQRAPHSSIPRFEDRGWWKNSEGLDFPYVVMQWVEGQALYSWAGNHRFTSAQVLRMGAQLASALAAAHAAGGVHRDVKGDNILITAEGRAVLLDWGGGTHSGAKDITDTTLPPGTYSYRTPEALRWSWAHRKTGEPYVASAADDVYALGVTLYRLCTGTYPPSLSESSGPQRRLLPPRELATVSRGLERLVLSCLSENPLARPPAATLAFQLCAAAAGLDASQPIVPTSAAAHTDQTSHPGSPRHHELPVWLSAAMAAVAGGLLVFAIMRMGQGRDTADVAPIVTEHMREVLAPDAPDGGVGEEVLANSEALPRVGPFILSLGRPMPKQPFPNQRRPPCERGERAINGACWVIVGAEEKPPCGEKMFDYEGRCYFASFDGQQQPTSEDPR